MTGLPPNDHFDGTRFFNPKHLGEKGLLSVLGWLITRRAKKWPQSVPNKLQSHPLTYVKRGEAALTFIGHSSFALQVGETNILLDPVFALRASPFENLGPQRVRPPGIAFHHLPPPHLVLVSHNHYDHLDLATLRRLRFRFNPAVITPVGNADLISTSGLDDITELDWWESTATRNVRVTIIPAQHFSARKFSDRNKALWGGFVIEAEGRTVLFAGDSGYGDHFKAIGKAFPQIDLALLPIGAYAPRWFMKENHMDPAEAVQAFIDLKAKRAIGMHYGTFQLTDEAINEPAEELAKALKAKNLGSNDFTLLDFGETLTF